MSSMKRDQMINVIAELQRADLTGQETLEQMTTATQGLLLGVPAEIAAFEAEARQQLEAQLQQVSDLLEISTEMSLNASLREYQHLASELERRALPLLETWADELAKLALQQSLQPPSRA